jgi:hypothetical protein
LLLKIIPQAAKKYHTFITPNFGRIIKYALETGGNYEDERLLPVAAYTLLYI